MNLLLDNDLSNLIKVILMYFFFSFLKAPVSSMLYIKKAKHFNKFFLNILNGTGCLSMELNATLSLKNK